jgi:hypothetical protein
MGWFKGRAWLVALIFIVIFIIFAIIVYSVFSHFLPIGVPKEQPKSGDVSLPLVPVATATTVIEAPIGVPPLAATPVLVVAPKTDAEPNNVTPVGIVVAPVTNTGLPVTGVSTGIGSNEITVPVLPEVQLSVTSAQPLVNPGPVTSPVAPAAPPLVVEYIPDVSTVQPETGGQAPLCFERFEDKTADGRMYYRYRPVYTPAQAEASSGRGTNAPNVPYCYQVSETVANIETGEPLSKPIDSMEVLQSNYAQKVPALFRAS